MAKIVDIPPFRGTHSLICIYKMHGKYYMRRASRLSGDRVKSDPRFHKTMQHAALLAKGSGAGSKVYAALPPHRKVHTLYRKLTGEAMQWLKYGWKEEDVIDLLLKIYKETPIEIIPKKKPSAVPAKETRVLQEWQPLRHQRSIHVFVRNMLQNKRGWQNKKYDRYLALEERKQNEAAPVAT